MVGQTDAGPLRSLIEGFGRRRDLWKGTKGLTRFRRSAVPCHRSHQTSGVRRPCRPKQSHCDVHHKAAGRVDFGIVL
jgi:hypothetical protein